MRFESHARDQRIVLILSIQVEWHRCVHVAMFCIVRSTMHSAIARCVRHRSMQPMTCASTRFVKWSRCFLHSGVIGMPCMSIRDGTFSIAPSLTWRAQWRNVRRQRRRRQRLRRRRSALRSGSRRETFSIHVTKPATSIRAITIVHDIAGSRNDGGRRRDDNKSLRRPRSVWALVSLISFFPVPLLSLPGFVCLKRCGAL